MEDNKWRYERLKKFPVLIFMKIQAKVEEEKMNTRHCVVLNLQHHGHLQDFRINKSQNEAILYVENANVILTNFYIHS